MIDVEVCFIAPRDKSEGSDCIDRQPSLFLKKLSLSDDATVADAIEASALAAAFPAIVFDDLKTAIFGKLVGRSMQLRHGDRIEVCRPLLLDPMAARRRRAKKTGKPSA